jgi:epoxyqueuosine reductase QueG
LENLKQDIKNIALELGFSNCRVTNEITYFNEADSFLQWLKLNYNYKMSFLERNLEKLSI